jgi:hypothetical protein
MYLLWFCEFKLLLDGINFLIAEKANERRLDEFRAHLSCPGDGALNGDQLPDGVGA